MGKEESKAAEALSPTIDPVKRKVLASTRHWEQVTVPVQGPCQALECPWGWKRSLQ